MKYQEEERAVIFVAYELGAIVLKRVGRPYPTFLALSTLVGIC